VSPVRSPYAPHEGGSPAVCPHCWMVNPGPSRLCARCGQESGGLRRTAPVQSPVPVEGGPRLNVFQRAVVGVFLAVLALGYLLHLLPLPEDREGRPVDGPVPVVPSQ